MVRSVRTNELQQKKNIKEYVNRPVRSVRTNELQQHRDGHGNSCDWCAPCAPTNYNHC